MRNQHVLDFFPTGEVESMYSDNFQLSFLGEQSIQRATEIRFNEDTQTWAICPPWIVPDDWGDTRPYYGGEGFSTYEDAREVEIAWLNGCRIEGVSPDSPDGLVVLAKIREALGL